MTHSTDTVTWRVLAEHLTPRQIEDLAQHETAHAAEQKNLVNEAIDYAGRNLFDNLMFGDVPQPTGATKVYAADQLPDGTWAREFVETSVKVTDVTIQIDGVQFPDGTVQRRLAIYVDSLRTVDDGHLTAADARTLAAALNEAADNLDLQ